LLDHVQFPKVLSPVDYSLVGDEDAAADRAHEAGRELVATSLVLVGEHVVKLFHVVAKHVADEIEAKIGFELEKQVIVFNDAVVV